MELTTELKEKLRDKARMEIALELGISYHTFKKWIQTDHPNLTKKKTIQAILKHTEIKKENIFEAL